MRPSPALIAGTGRDHARRKVQWEVIIVAMRNNVPITGNPVIDAITRFFDWLDKQIDQVVPHAAPAATATADMTDEQLHHAIHDVGARLLNDLAPVLQRSFAGDAAHGDLRFPHGMPTGVRAHTLTLFAQAHDAFGLSVIGLGKHATAAALGPIRNIAEALALTRWLLESSDDDVRRARAYGLTLDAVDQYRKMARALGQSPQTRQLAPRLAAAEKQMRRNLTRLAEQDGITIEARPAKLSRLVERYVPEPDRLAYALLSSAGVHPGAARSYLFYGRPGTGIVDYDFKGMFYQRAYWLTQSVRLHLDLCQLVAPELGWHEWDAIAEKTEGDLRPLAEAAQRRFAAPLLQAMANAPDPPRT
jgi:hypothetical protein